jgi:hypothetical protein
VRKVGEERRYSDINVLGNLDVIVSEMNKNANERAIKFIKTDPRHAVLIINTKILDNTNKDFGNMLRAVNTFCQAGQEGYDKLAVVILDNKKADIESSVPIEHNNYVKSDNPNFSAIIGEQGGQRTINENNLCFESYDYTSIATDATQRG